MKSYIKIYGPPVLKAIQKLQALAIETPEVCIMDTIIANDIPRFMERDQVMRYFEQYGQISVERCDNLISASRGTLGEYDFVYDWFTPPTGDQVNELIGKIDETLADLGCKYTITTK